MKNKTIKTILVIFLFLSLSLTAQSTSINQEKITGITQKSENIKLKTQTSKSYYLGQMPMMPRIASIELTGGNESELQQIQNLLDSNGPEGYLFTILPVTNVSFNITCSGLPIRKAQMYLSIIIPDLKSPTICIFCKPHKISVKGLNGSFACSKRVLYRPIYGFFCPGYFGFDGKCEELEYKYL